MRECQCIVDERKRHAFEMMGIPVTPPTTKRRAYGLPVRFEGRNRRGQLKRAALLMSARPMPLRGCPQSRSRSAPAIS